MGLMRKAKAGSELSHGAWRGGATSPAEEHAHEEATKSPGAQAIQTSGGPENQQKQQHEKHGGVRSQGPGEDTLWSEGEPRKREHASVGGTTAGEGPGDHAGAENPKTEHENRGKPPSSWAAEAHRCEQLSASVMLEQDCSWDPVWVSVYTGDSAERKGNAIYLLAGSEVQLFDYYNASLLDVFEYLIERCGMGTAATHFLRTGSGRKLLDLRLVLYEVNRRRSLAEVRRRGGLCLELCRRDDPMARRGLSVWEPMRRGQRGTAAAPGVRWQWSRECGVSYVADAPACAPRESSGGSSKRVQSGPESAACQTQASHPAPNLFRSEGSASAGEPPSGASVALFGESKGSPPASPPGSNLMDREWPLSPPVTEPAGSTGYSLAWTWGCAGVAVSVASLWQWAGAATELPQSRSEVRGSPSPPPSPPPTAPSASVEGEPTESQMNQLLEESRFLSELGRLAVSTDSELHQLARALHSDQVSTPSEAVRLAMELSYDEEQLRRALELSRQPEANAPTTGGRARSIGRAASSNVGAPSLDSGGVDQPTNSGRGSSNLDRRADGPIKPSVCCAEAASRSAATKASPAPPSTPAADRAGAPDAASGKRKERETSFTWLHKIELASFRWPICTQGELIRLLTSRRVAPSILCGCEFTGAMRRAFERETGSVVLSVDTRDAEDNGLHFRGPLQLVLELEHAWSVAFLWPPCTHQVLSDTTSREDYKMHDGRTYWGLAFWLYCMCRPVAPVVVVEQPDTIIPDYIDLVALGVRRHRCRPVDHGDDYGKTINLFTSGCVPLVSDAKPGRGRPMPHFFTFQDAEERDRYRSSWARYPNMCARLAQRIASDGSRHGTLDYQAAIHRLAIEWHEACLPVPPGFDHPLGEPPDEAARLRQPLRGPSQGPLLELRVPDANHPPEAARAWLEQAKRLHVDASQLARGMVCILFVSHCARPLLLAHTNGMTVLGFWAHDLRERIPEPTDRWLSGVALAAGQRIASLALGLATPVLLAGHFESGPTLAVVPVAPAWAAPTTSVRGARTRGRALLAGLGFAWLSLEAFAGDGSAFEQLGALAWTALEALSRPVGQPADELPSTMRAWGAFKVGRVAASSMTLQPYQVPVTASGSAGCLRRLARDGERLHHALREGEDPDGYFSAWAERIQPLDPTDIPTDLLNALPNFAEATELDWVRLPHEPPPLQTEWLPLRPPQLPVGPEHCPKGPLDLYDEAARSRVRGQIRRWLEATLKDLQCVAAEGADCERIRPRAIAIGAKGMHSWAQGRIFDFTFERHPTCGVPLDFHTPMETHLNLPFLRRRLEGYPDQRLLSFLMEGVRLEAYVELQSVWVPHLTSLSAGFESVQKELLRLEEKGWYRSFDSIPFWPCYINGQGATARKLEPWRFRRTTEGGGPRQETFDETGLRAWSINEASKVYHLPAHFSSDPRPVMQEWIRSQLLGLPELQPPLVRQSKWPPEVKPTLESFMQALSVLRRAAHELGEPLYVFSDDAADYFNQLALSPESWPLFLVAFTEPTHQQLRFISERRLGFGCHPASKIAQRFSDALLHMFRADFDESEERLLRAGQASPRLLRWLSKRRRVAHHYGTPVQHEQRLYHAAMYADDPCLAVVGVERAVRALRVWRQLTQDAGLIMAIPEKRHLGGWVKWLGVLVVAGLGIIVIPRDKLLRAQEAIRRVLAGGMEFGTYRSLVGLLEHLRCVNRRQADHMYGLYEPHIHEARHAAGPSGAIIVTELMRKQLRRWESILMCSGGVSVTAAVPRGRVAASTLRRRLLRRLPSSAASRPADAAHVYITSADAATDGDSPGLGGFLHGFWWHLPFPPEMRGWLHITVLELLATGFNLIIFEPILRNHHRVIALSDALATPHVLSRRARSDMLREAHQALLDNPRFARMTEVVEIAHVYGDINQAADLASRLKVAELHRLCAAVGAQAQRVPIPADVHLILQRVFLHAQRGGHYHRHTERLPSTVVVPAVISDLTVTNPGDPGGRIAAVNCSPQGSAPP